MYIIIIMFFAVKSWNCVGLNLSFCFLEGVLRIVRLAWPAPAPLVLYVSTTWRRHLAVDGLSNDLSEELFESTLWYHFSHAAPSTLPRPSCVRRGSPLVKSNRWLHDVKMESCTFPLSTSGADNSSATSFSEIVFQTIVISLQCARPFCSRRWPPCLVGMDPVGGVII